MKREFLGVGHDLLDQLSPAFCGGLIEAAWWRAARPVPPPNFPPRSAGASLKPGDQRDPAVGVAHFPPRSAGASLKLRRRAVVLPIDHTFPRVLRGPH